jgi:thiol-disulfide isomerase/thioredoxin
VEVAGWDQLQQWVASQTGKVVVVDVWSTFCLTCMQEFPRFVELHEKYGNRVACASLNVDFYGGEGNNPKDAEPRVVEFLTSRNATMKNFLSSDADEAILRHIDTAAIPAAVVFDQQGKLHKVFNNDGNEYGPDGFKYEQHVTPVIDALLSAAP